MLDINWNTQFFELIKFPSTSRNLTRFVFFLTLVLCCWTHPRYHRARSARLFRVPFGILSAAWWLCHPFAFAVTPLETNFQTNIGHYFLCYILFTKTVDWTFFSGPQTRRKFVQTTSNPLSGIWQAADKKVTSTLDDIYNLSGHVLFQFTSLRGLQYPWGHFSEINRNSLKSDLTRFVIFQVYSLIAMGTLLNRGSTGCSTIQEESNMFAMNFNAFGYVLHHWKSTMMVITGLCATCEAVLSFLAVFCHLVHPPLIRFGFPDHICEFFNPVYLPPLFGNLLQMNSIADFWGKFWHQIFRRSFIVLGSFPLAGLAIALGINPKYQRATGFMGAFIASGFLHAGQFWFVSDTSTFSVEKQRIVVFLCFLSQGFGSLIEQKVIRFIPKWLGGGKLWTICFILCTIPFFSHLATKPGRFLSILDPVEEWGFFHVVTPLLFAPFFPSISS